MSDTFFKIVDDVNIGQLLGFVSNVSGIIQGGQLVLSVFEQSDTTEILDAIIGLQQTVERDFRELGDVIAQQTQVVVNTVNRDSMALALSHSDVAANRIQEFLTNNDSQALEAAKTESIAGVRFFTELGLNSPDLSFFLPGLAKAGTIRIFVIAAEPTAVHEPRAVVVDDINLMATFLASMIDSVKRTVDAAHTVSRKSHFTPCSAVPQVLAGLPDPTTSVRRVFVIDGYEHDENGEPLKFFDAQQGNPPCEQPSGFEDEAQSGAIQHRNQGVADELAILGIPGFEQILQSWRSLLTA